VRLLADEVMRRVNSARESETTLTCGQFYDNTFLSYCEASLRPSSVHSYKQIWKQHLQPELGAVRLTDYRTHQASTFLTGLASKLGRRTLSHVRSLMSSVFSQAMNRGLIESNPVAGCKVLGKIRAPEPTDDYTRDEAEACFVALAGMADCQLVFALGFFQGLRPSEIAGLQWSDVGEDSVSVHRSCVNGHVGPTKTLDSAASIPLIEPVRTLLASWAAKSAPRKCVFENRNGGPTDLRNMTARRIKPRLKEKGVRFKPLYALRRGSATHLTALIGNPLAAAQLLRHSSVTTTMTHYVKHEHRELVGAMKKFEDEGR
jgi:integrase